MPSHPPFADTGATNTASRPTDALSDAPEPPGRTSTDTLFTGKSQDYAKFRATYPEALLTYLAVEEGLAGKVIADVGAGTGIFSCLLAPIAQTVYAVEPNADMRNACEQHCRDQPNLSVIHGHAENTLLPDNSVDALTVAQAFHWFDIDAFKAEGRRILREGGRVFLIWNILDDSHPVTRGVRKLSDRLALHDRSIRSTWLDDRFETGSVFKGTSQILMSFPNDRTYTRDSFVGRYLSTSYAPKPGTPDYDAYVAGITHVFDTHQTQGTLEIPYRTRCYCGEI